MSTQATLSKHPTSIALKGGMFTLTAIQILDDDLEGLSAELEEKISQAPNFFLYAPIILDFQHLKEHPECLDMPALLATLKSKKLIPVGIRGANKALKDICIELGLAVFPEEKIILTKKRTLSGETKEIKTDTTALANLTVKKEAVSPSTRLITQPVRSGQQIYAQGGDLIVLGPVSHGAELLADGHIHVYGSMRGRALAGVLGDKNAMIFCRSLEAELISIAGQYRLSEDLKETLWKQPACIQLQDGRLNIKPV